MLPSFFATVIQFILSFWIVSEDYRKPIVYLIRHGEKPADGGNGLSAEGFNRSLCVADVFGAKSLYNISYILAPTPNTDGSGSRSYDTVLPLAKSLGLTIDIHCSRNEHKCVKKAIKHYRGPGNVLVCWQHSNLRKIVKNLGYKHPPKYPSGHFDIIWTDPPNYHNITDERSECCPGLDQC